VDLKVAVCIKPSAQRPKDRCALSEDVCVHLTRLT
jgi:hypothetical protein